MNKSTFLLALSRVRDAGVRVASSEYSENSFGSWYVTIDVEPIRRLVWDGKERWLIVEEQHPEKVPDWQDLWLERNPKLSDLPIGLRKLLSSD